MTETLSRDLPRITVVTPCFNMARFVERTIESVLGQAYPNLDYRVVDGGSTDGSREIIERHEGALTYFVSEPDRGQYDAINKGFAASDGDVMAWLNADDVYLPSALRTVGEVFRSFPEVQWVSGGVAFINTQDEIIGVDRLDGGRSRELAARGCYRAGLADYLPQEGMFWRRGLWERAGGQVDATLKLAADFELWTRFARFAEPVTLKCIVAGFRRHPSAQRSTVQRREYEAETARVAERFPAAPRLWRWAGRHVGLNFAYRSLFVRGESTTLEYDLQHDRWVLLRRSGRLYRPFVTRRAV